MSMLAFQSFPFLIHLHMREYGWVSLVLFGQFYSQSIHEGLNCPGTIVYCFQSLNLVFCFFVLENNFITYYVCKACNKFLLLETGDWRLVSLLLSSSFADVWNANNISKLQVLEQLGWWVTDYLSINIKLYFKKNEASLSRKYFSKRHLALNWNLICGLW